MGQISLCNGAVAAADMIGIINRLPVTRVGMHRCGKLPPPDLRFRRPARCCKHDRIGQAVEQRAVSLGAVHIGCAAHGGGNIAAVQRVEYQHGLVGTAGRALQSHGRARIVDGVGVTAFEHEEGGESPMLRRVRP